MIILSDFRIRFPELSAIDDAIITMLIDEAYLSITESFGKFQDTAVLYWVAHNAVGVNGGMGNNNYSTSSESADGVSVSFAVPTALNDIVAYFQTTGYGQKYLYYYNIVKSGQARIV